MTESDERLVAATREGDAGAFDTLIRRHLRSAHAVALAGTGNVADAEDVCQDAFLAALERLEDCRNPARFRPWLLTIVRNRAHNFRRYRNLRNPTGSGEAAAGPIPGDAPAPWGGPGSPSGSDPSRELDLSLLRERLLSALGEIPDLQRETVLLHDLDGMSHREIGEILGITEGSSRVYLHRARRRLRELLESPVTEED